MTLFRKTILVALLGILFLPTLAAQSISLQQGFQHPPSTAKARTIWFWINGNVTKSGITEDLKAMKKVGIQGAILFNVSLGHPGGVAPYLSTEWLDLLNFTALEAKRLGLELGFHNGAGWSSSGGPGITPEYGMQKLVYTETIHQGGKIFNGRLAQPETQLGYYKDISVLAFPKPKGEERIDNLSAKSLSGKVRNHLAPDDQPVSDLAIVRKSTIINLTAKFTTDGFLEWDAPEGEWVILRIGHTPTGETNRFPSDGGQGLECDKMNAHAVDLFWETSINPIISRLDTLIGTVVTRCHVDSYEVGTANWTSGFANEFKKLRSYDCQAYLPALAGYYVESGEETERFLWDFRRTIGDLIAKNYYGHIAKLSHQYGMSFSAEPYWGPFDNMQVGEKADIVMSEFWSGHLAFFDSPKFVASIAKLNGSSIAEAEAFTAEGGWIQHPGSLKAIGDLAWAQGINRFVFHSYVHQPWNVAPGLTLQRFGIDFNRLNTWWDQGKPFVDYIGRGQFLLQQGRSVADVLVFTGESSPNDALLMPEVKALGYDYDVIGSNKISSLSVNEGLICTSTGERYRALVLPPTPWVTPETLTKIRELAGGGAIIFGTKPQKSPSLKNYPACDEEVRQLAEELWGDNLIKEGSILDYLKSGSLPPDFSVEQGSNEHVDYIHRKKDGADIYFVVNSAREGRELNCRFRVAGKQPELWNAETGEITMAAIWQQNEDGTTTVSIPFEQEGAVFVIFRQNVSSAKHLVSAEMELQNPKVEPLPNLKVIKAEYGTFLPDGLVDVTEAVASSVQGNKLKIAANRELSASDPAPGYKKELRIRYKTGGLVLEKSAMEKEFLEVTGVEDEKLEILKAVFGKFERGMDGIPPNNPVYDVSREVKSMIASGVFEIPVSNLLPDEKDANENNVLRLVYSTNGERETVYVPYGSTLNLTQPTAEPKLTSQGGKVSWTTPLAGKITYRTSRGKTKTLKVKSVPEPIRMSGAWEVSFIDTNRNFENRVFNELSSWTNSSDKHIRYFSGTASYKKQFTVPAGLLKSSTSLELDLGSVKEIVEVILNGKNLGIIWKAPFRINIDHAVVEGANKLELKITNLWPNRLIGDEQFPKDFEANGPLVKQWPEWLLNSTARPTGRVTFAGYKHWNKDSELLPSGLLGPVKIVASKIRRLK
ncbi:glycosyl hydrolase [Neolewinella agarilytica]|uniref:Alpha-L-rhamnosidase n=1 Tax=Neolewinella agarilytica TaxID=478744 RepID=A0A1H9D8N4_9BACT|nr:glycosyl hydrolase [Neolewinella agarilytica]SEQ09138.1 alpha-L-rhamnosidase [Neolewinella agarilytica]